MKKTIALAITGASGATYAVRLLEILLASGCDVHLTISGAAQAVLKTELDMTVDLDNFNLAMLMLDGDPNPKDRVVCHRPRGLPQREPNNTCPVCGEETLDQYMVTKACWLEAQFDFYDNAHMKCLEKRLDRPLVSTDFVVAPINEGITP